MELLKGVVNRKRLRNTVLDHFLITILHSLVSFYATTHLSKKKPGEMLVEQIFEFEFGGPGPPGRTCTLITAYFHDKTKISQKNL